MALAAAVVAGWGVRGAADAGFGPPGEEAAKAKPAAYRYTVDWPVAARAETPIARTLRRIDAGGSGVQNWEVALAVARSGATADQDEVIAQWMDGRQDATNRTETRLAFARSIDGARTFETMRPPTPTGLGNLPFDPMLAANPANGRVYRGAIAQAGDVRALWVEGSNDGAAFELPNVAERRARVDKGWLAAGVGANGGELLALAHNFGLQLSIDGGTTYTPALGFPAGGSLPFPRVLAGGAVGVAYYQIDGRTEFVRWTDGAFGPPTVVHRFTAQSINALADAVPASFRIPPFSPLAVDPRNGSLYTVVNDVVAIDGNERDVDVLLLSSRDGGATWSTPTRVTGDAPAYSDQFMPWLEVDAAGRLHIAYFDTRRHTGNDAAADVPVDAWYAVSTDGGASFAHTRLTDTALAAGVTNWSPLAPVALQFLGDYLGVAVSDNAAYVAHPAAIDGAVAMQMNRIAFDDLPDAVAAVADPRGLNGAWFDPASSGQGLETQWLDGNVLLAVFYGHRGDGSNLFLLGTRIGVPAFGETLSIPLTVTRGGRFENFDPAAITRAPWGTLELTFDDCDRARARLVGQDGTQTLALTRVARHAGLNCG